MIRIAVCDDEKYMAEKIQAMASDFFRFSDGGELLQYNKAIDIDKTAKGMGIAACCRLTLPYPCSVHDMDFCIILSNALDNAIHTGGSIRRFIKGNKSWSRGRKRRLCFLNALVRTPFFRYNKE